MDLQAANKIEIRSIDFNGNWNSVVWYPSLEAPEEKVLAGDKARMDQTNLPTPVGDCALDDPENMVPGDEACPQVGASDTAIVADAASASPQLQAGGAGWGIADEKAAIFDLKGFTDLNPRIVRKIVPWDIWLRHLDWNLGTGAQAYECRKWTYYVPSDDNTWNEFRTWYDKAVAQGREVFISFGASRTPPNDYDNQYPRGKELQCYLPSKPQYKRAIAGFMGTYPNIKLYSAWNEPNLPNQPTSYSQNKTKWNHRLKGPQQAGRFYQALASLCQAPCKPAAAEFVDEYGWSNKTIEGSDDAPRANRRFWSDYLVGLGTERPRYWALHAYWTGENDTSRLAQFIRAARGRRHATDVEVWLTEQGPRWHNAGGPAHSDFDGAPAAAWNTQDSTTSSWMTNLMKTRSVSPKITMYLSYQMISCAGATVFACPYWQRNEGWDSGVLKHSNTDPAWNEWIPRTMWGTLRNCMNPQPGQTCPS